MYKFFIDDIEVNEPLNWQDIIFGLEQDVQYFGYFGIASIDKVELFGESANKMSAS